MKKSGKKALALAIATLTAGCNQSFQARTDEDPGVALVRQWQAESQLLSPRDRASYVASRISTLLPDRRLNSCATRRY